MTGRAEMIEKRNKGGNDMARVPARTTAESELIMTGKSLETVKSRYTAAMHRANTSDTLMSSRSQRNLKPRASQTSLSAV